MNNNLSKFNLYIDDNNKKYIYNLISGSIVEINYNLFMYFTEIDKTKAKKIDKHRFSGKLIQLLIDKNILYEDENDEMSLLEFKYNKDKYDDSFLSIVMLPTLQCNLKCHYCYEKSKTKHITDEKVEYLKLFLKKQSLLKKGITIRWSGGEVLLIWDKIKKLSKDIISICKENNCVYTASMITNATLLNEKIIDEMIECKIESLQITIDGSPNIHNTIRFYSDKKGTFDDILKNIELASQKMKILLRLNIDKNNFPSMEELFKIIGNSSINKKNVQIFCKPVLCTLAREPQTQLFSQHEFLSIDLKLLRLAQKFNLAYAFHMGINGMYSRCAYTTLQGFYVSPDLKVYKCPIYVDADGENSIGFISDSGNMKLTNYREYNKCLSYNPMSLEECKECRILPICHGKCPVIWELLNKEKDAGCIADKYTIEEKIKYSISSDIQLEALTKSGFL